MAAVGRALESFEATLAVGEVDLFEGPQLVVVIAIARRIKIRILMARGLDNKGDAIHPEIAHSG